LCGIVKVLHVIDEVLVPLMSISPESSVDNPDAATFLAQSESIQLGSHRVRLVQYSSSLLPYLYLNGAKNADEQGITINPLWMRVQLD